MISAQEQSLSLYRLWALPNGQFNILEYKDPHNPDSHEMSPDKTEHQVREFYRERLRCPEELIDQRLQNARQALDERRNRR